MTGSRQREALPIFQAARASAKAKSIAEAYGLPDSVNLLRELREFYWESREQFRHYTRKQVRPVSAGVTLKRGGARATKSQARKIHATVVELQELLLDAPEELLLLLWGDGAHPRASRLLDLRRLNVCAVALQNLRTASGNAMRLNAKAGRPSDDLARSAVQFLGRFYRRCVANKHPSFKHLSSGAPRRTVFVEESLRLLNINLGHHAITAYLKPARRR